MNKHQILESLKKVRENSHKRAFDQTIDLIINLKNINLKKEDDKQDIFITMPHSRGKKVKTCAFVDQQLFKEAKKCCDRVITNDEFSKLKKQEIKRIAKDYTFFIAQAPLMGEIAKYFGRTLGPRGKMPNPKSGCIVPGNAVLDPLVARLQKTVRAITKNEPIIKVPVGTESMKDEELTDNIDFVYSELEHHLPQGKNNIKALVIKTTMGKPIKIKEKDGS